MSVFNRMLCLILRLFGIPYILSYFFPGTREKYNKTYDHDAINMYSRVRIFRSHSDKKMTSNYPKFELSEYIVKTFG